MQLQSLASGCLFCLFCWLAIGSCRRCEEPCCPAGMLLGRIAIAASAELAATRLVLSCGALCRCRPPTLT